MTTIRVKANIIPWDDPAFRHAFEEARDETLSSGQYAAGPQAAARVQLRLRESGYPDARVEGLRTVEEALEHVSHWTVRRDG